MIVKDLKQLFRSETSRMEEAVAAKDFRTAADLTKPECKYFVVTFDRALTFQISSHSLRFAALLIASTVNQSTK